MPGLVQQGICRQTGVVADIFWEFGGAKGVTWKRRRKCSTCNLRYAIVVMQVQRRFDKMDSYVRAEVDGHKGPRTRTVKNTLCPEWEEDFVIPMSGEVCVGNPVYGPFDL